MVPPERSGVSGAVLSGAQFVSNKPEAIEPVKSNLRFSLLFMA
jgi:hypothetical protein